jgi:hypothetical protein
LFASGVPTAEKPQARRFYLLSYGPDAREEYRDAWRHYKAYLNRTSILIPIPPVLYRPLPGIIKKTFLLDFGMYHFDEDKDGAAAIEEERAKAAQA